MRHIDLLTNFNSYRMRNKGLSINYRFHRMLNTDLRDNHTLVNCYLLFDRVYGIINIDRLLNWMLTIPFWVPLLKEPIDKNRSAPTFLLHKNANAYDSDCLNKVFIVPGSEIRVDVRLEEFNGIQFYKQFYIQRYWRYTELFMSLEMLGESKFRKVIGYQQQNDLLVKYYKGILYYRFTFYSKY